MNDLNHQQAVQAAQQAHLDVTAARQKKIEVVRQLNDVNKHERDVRERIAALEAAEAQAMSKWAANGAKGNAPALDHAAREALNNELVEAQAKTKAAERTAQAVQAEIREMDGKCAQALSAHKVASLALLTSYAGELGENFRQARIEVERNRAMLLALARLLADNQRQDDHLTTAFLPIVQPHINQRDFYVEKVQAEAMAAASEHWQKVWGQCMRADFEAPKAA